MTDIRICSTCRLRKPLSEFCNRAKGRDGHLTIRCKMCRDYSNIIRVNHEHNKMANIEKMRLGYAGKLEALQSVDTSRYGRSNLRMVDQRLAVSILTVIRQLP